MTSSSRATTDAVDTRNPERVRRLFERLGPIYIKIGQYLAMRPDILPQEYCDELLNLMEHAPHSPWPMARRILIEDLGQEPETLFEWIETTPLAAASLCQVHLARTREGQMVAVKIQREGIRREVARSLRLARLNAGLVDLSGILLVVSARDVLREVGDWLRNELDYEHELQNLIRMYELSKQSEEFRVPRPFPGLSGPRVIVMEYLAGISFADLLRLVRLDQTEAIREMGLDQNELADKLIHTLLQQIFRHNCFQVDTHPGNLIAFPGNVIGFIDFGLVDSLADNVRQSQMRYLSATYRGDTEEVFRALTEILIPGKKADLENFHSDFLSETRSWLHNQDNIAIGNRNHSSPNAGYITGIIRAARRNGLRIPPDILTMYRAFLTAESVAQQLNSKADTAAVGRRFFLRMQIDEALKSINPDQLRTFAFDVVSLLRDGPGLVHRIITDLADNRLTVHVRTAESREDRLQTNARVRLLTAAILTVAVVILLAAMKDSHIAGPSWLPALPTLIWVVLIAVVLWIVLLWRKLW
jgi:ubiquinone biosynthesis protein